MPVAVQPVAYKEATNRLCSGSLFSGPMLLCLHLFLGTLKLFQHETGGLSVALAHKRSLG